MNSEHPAMSNVSVWRFIIVALKAAVWGSAAGTLLFVCYFSVVGVERNYIWLILISPIIFGVSLCGTIPGAVVFGVPVLWPIRKAVARRPVLTSIAAAMVGIGCGFFGFSWSFRNPAIGQLEGYQAVILFSTTTALAFVACLSREPSLKADD